MMMYNQCLVNTQSQYELSRLRKELELSICRQLSLPRVNSCGYNYSFNGEIIQPLKMNRCRSCNPSSPDMCARCCNNISSVNFGFSGIYNTQNYNTIKTKSYPSGFYIKQIEDFIYENKVD